MRRQKDPDVCMRRLCREIAHAGGLCRVHFTQRVALLARRGVCSVDGCPEARQSFGMCSRHVSYWRRHGTPEYVAPTPLERYESMAGSRTDGCRQWRGYVDKAGYARMNVDGEAVYVHRWIYEQIVGPIPERHEIDHVCHNVDPACNEGSECLHRSCTNTEHLVPRLPKAHAHQSPNAPANRTHCPAGHPYDEANTYYRKDRPGARECRACSRTRNRERKRRLLAAKRNERSAA